MDFIRLSDLPGTYARIPSTNRINFGGVAPTELKPGYERVHTVTDYYDGPRKGIADFQGEPHIYESIFDESKGKYSELFRLAPIAPETFWAAMEDWAIWQRYELAYHSGKADLSSHPALPHETQRHSELEAILEKVLVIDVHKAITRIARFEPLGNIDLPRGVLRPLQVKWTEP